MSGLDVEAISKEMQSATDPKRLLQLALKQAETDPEGVRKDIKLLDPTSVDAPSAITIKLGERQFKPLVAYPIYAADYIRGFKNPRLLIEFDEVTLLPYVHFEADEKVNEDAPDPVQLLKDFLPSETVYDDRSAWEAKRKEEGESFGLLKNVQPLMTLENNYEVRLLKFDSEESTRYLRRVFTFCWFFIEGAQTPDYTDQTWEVYVVNEASGGAFVGYTSVYSFFYYINGQFFETNAAEKRTVRKRIAHFLILPPFQGHGIGKALYLALAKQFVADPHVLEIEVEEPSTGFEILRDRAHYEWLTNDETAKSKLEEYYDEPEEALNDLQKQFKMDPVQLQRVAELHEYMSNGQKESRRLKKMIKSRLWAHNYEDLRDMDPATQRDQLQRVYENVLHSHLVVLHLAEPDEEEEDEEEDEEDENGLPTNPAELLLAQLAQGMTSNLADLPQKKRKTE